MTVNITASPYYDDYVEDKNYQRILFKPGVSVQSRELNQIQSIFHNSISKTADGIYGDGARITNEPVSFNILDDEHGQIIRSIKLAGAGSNVASYVGKYITGVTSNTIGLVRFAYAKDDPDIGDPTTLVISVESFKGVLEFNENETVRIYNNFTDAFNRTTAIAASETTEFNTVITGTAAASAYDDEITFTSLSAPLKIGDELDLPSPYRKGLVVTKVLSALSARLNDTLKSDVVTSQTLTFRRRNTCLSSIVSISSGVYYKNGYYTKIEPQSVVPDKYTNAPTKSIILKYSESIIDYSEDETLLDPAFESSNYLAPGADRFKTSLTIDSVDLNSNNLPDTSDDHIEVVRFVEGRTEFVENAKNTLPLYLNNIIAERTYDESGNYEVVPFRLTPKGSSSDDTYAKFHVNPGKVVVGGQSIETVGPTQLNVLKSKTYDSLEDIFVNVNQDEYIIIDNPQFGYLDPNKLKLYDVLECHSTTDRSAMSNPGTAIGYLLVRHMVYDSGEGANTRYRLYPLWYYQSSSLLGIRDIRSFVSKQNIFSVYGGNDGTYNAPKFYANVNSVKGFATDNKLQGYDFGPRKRLFFPVDNKYLKSISNIRIYHSKKIENQTVTGSTLTVSLSGTEQFVGNAGALSDDTKRRYYQALVRSTSSGSLAAGQPINLDEVDFTVNADKNILTINLGSYVVTGTIDLYVTIYNSELGRKTKLLNRNYVTEPISIQISNLGYSTFRSDIYALRGIYSIGSNVFHREYNSGTTYATNDCVSKDGVIYKAKSSSTGQAVTNTTYWAELAKEPSSLYTFDNGAKDTHYAHAFITYKGNIQSYNPGNVLLVLDYFSHSGTGVIDFNSYPASIQNNIPLYRSEDGTVFDLRNCLDFRPKQNDTNVAANFFADNNSNSYVLPNPVLENALQIDYDYYQGRIDRLYLQNRQATKDKKGFNFNIVQGIPGLYPSPPKDVSSKDNFLIGTLVVPPFTKASHDISIIYNSAPRYTMSDINTLDKRISTLEKRVKKQGLDIVALNNQVFEGGNTELLLFKTGILIEDFSNILSNDLRSPHSTCTVDTTNKELKPSYSAVSYNLFFENEPDLNVENDIVTFNVVSEEAYINVSTPTFTKITSGNQSEVAVSTVNPNNGGVKSVGTGILSSPELNLLTVAGGAALIAAGQGSQILAGGVVAGGQLFEAGQTALTLVKAGGEALVEGIAGITEGSGLLATGSGLLASASTSLSTTVASATGSSLLASAASAIPYVAAAYAGYRILKKIFKWSDDRLKKNIRKIYTDKSGINIYQYEIFGKKEIGVIAQELLKTHPDLVIKNGDYYMVDYDGLEKKLLGF